MTDAQLQVLAAAIRAEAAATPNAVISAFTENPTLTLGEALSSRIDNALALYMNGLTSFVVWRHNVTRAELYHQTSDAALAGGSPTTWNWTTYKNQSATEQNAWTQMFMGDQADFTLANLRAGVDAIFSGAGAPATQRAHIAAIAKRYISRAEFAFKSGAGTVAAPGDTSFRGTVSHNDVSQALSRF